MFAPGTMSVLFTQQRGNEIRIFIQLMLSDMKYTWSQFTSISLNYSKQRKERYGFNEEGLLILLYSTVVTTRKYQACTWVKEIEEKPNKKTFKQSAEFNF